MPNQSLGGGTDNKMEQLKRFIKERLFQYPELAECQDNLSIVLAGSRAIGYCTPVSDYDLLGLCDGPTYARVLKRTGRDSSVAGIDISVARDEAKQLLDREVDVAIYEVDRIQRAFHEYNDVVLWIWTNAKVITDPCHIVSELQASFQGYPKEILEKKLKQHFLRDLHLSVHGLTYIPESQNLFAVLNTMTSKISEMCKICCLLEGKPFPYEKWLLRASAETRIGKRLISIFEQVLTTLSRLNNDLMGNWAEVRTAIDAIDTEACDIIEAALVSWGIDRSWLEHSYYHRHNVLFQPL
jgi:hypothetical protein